MGSKTSTPLIPSPRTVSFLAESLKCNEKTIWDSFERFKTYAPDLKMDKRTFIAKFQEKNKSSDAREIGEILFKYFDADNSGYITFVEYFIPNAFIYQANPRQRASVLFHICDTNDDNVVSEREITRMLEGLSHIKKSPLNKNQISKTAKELCAQMDVDGNKKISKEEFVYAMLSNQSVRELLDFNYANF